ncbi:MAG: tRNA preQ1(34) S-adenosylmethionine ribosyltransferase-isomerase QueA [Thermodesulfobacteriota bacterium]
MNTEEFSYHLPADLVAFYPEERRDCCNLMVVDRNNGNIQHRNFYELKDILHEGDSLVLNNTKVIPARLYGKRDSGKRIEVFLVDKINTRIWKCLVRNPKAGMEIKFERGVSGKLNKNGRDEWSIVFQSGVDEYVGRYGKMPLPPYITREPEEADNVYYQTVYARESGAIAAPTAGLHFSDELLSRLEKIGVEINYLTLHVGIGTFKPVKTARIEDHHMHEEYREIPEETSRAINRAKQERRRVIAVGTTAVRALESSVDNSGNLRSSSGFTDLFIYPGFQFKVVDVLLTNFHLPRSTLMMLVSAFAGKELIFKAYKEAIEKRYRLLSYGDAMLIV